MANRPFPVSVVHTLNNYSVSDIKEQWPGSYYAAAELQGYMEGSEWEFQMTGWKEGSESESHIAI